MWKEQRERRIVERIEDSSECLGEEGMGGREGEMKRKNRKDRNVWRRDEEEVGLSKGKMRKRRRDGEEGGTERVST